MKYAHYLFAIIVGQIVLTASAMADSAQSYLNNSSDQVDPDGIPYSVTHPQSRQLSREEIAAMRQQRQRAIEDSDWLVRSYQQEVRNHSSTDSSNGQTSNYYYQLSSNRELARLAGIPQLNLTVNGSTSVPLPTRPAVQRDTILVNPSLAANQVYKPLISPFSSVEAAGQHSISSFIPSVITPALSWNSTPTSAISHSNDLSDSNDIETPGMIAVQKDPLALRNPSDLDLDVLPGETVEEAKKHQANANNLELAVPLSADQLHRAQATALTPVKAASATSSALVNAPPKTVPVEDPNAPMPVTKVLQITPVRSPIARPYDILDR